jgi:hypothetical protein
LTPGQHAQIQRARGAGADVRRGLQQIPYLLDGGALLLPQLLRDAATSGTRSDLGPPDTCSHGVGRPGLAVEAGAAATREEPMHARWWLDLAGCIPTGARRCMVSGGYILIESPNRLGVDRVGKLCKSHTFTSTVASFATSSAKICTLAATVGVEVECGDAGGASRRCSTSL